MTTTPEPPVPPPGEETDDVQDLGNDAEAAPWSDGQPGQDDALLEPDES